MKFLLAVGMLVCVFFAYVSYDAYNNRDEYIEACLYISDTIEQKRDCYNVYPENYKQEWAVKGISSVVALLFLGGFYFVIKTNGSTEAH